MDAVSIGQIICSDFGKLKHVGILRILSVCDAALMAREEFEH